jgi:capsular exopolysaccharide synthesis family protein
MQRQFYEMARTEPTPYPEIPGRRSSQFQPQFDLRATMALLRRQRRLVGGTIIAVVALAALVGSQLERRYTATALLAVDARDSELVGFAAGPDVFGAPSAIDTEVEIARSTAVLDRAAGVLGLNALPEFTGKPSLVSRLLLAVGLREAPTTDVANRKWADLSAAERADLVGRLARDVEIARRGASSVMSVAATANTPDTAAGIANTVAQSYIDNQIETKVNSTQRAADFLRERVNSLAQEVDDLDLKIETFVTSKLAELGTPEAKAMLKDLEQKRVARGQEVSTLNSLQAAIDQKNYDQVSRLLDSGTANYALRRSGIADALAAPETDPARLERLRGDLAALDNEIEAAAAARVAALQNELSGADRDSAQLRAQLTTALSSQDVPSDVAAELFRLQRDAEVQRNLYGTYLTKLRQVEQQAVFALPDTRIVAAAAPPSDPSFPPLKLIAGAALFLSVFASFGLALLREHYVGGLTSVDQLESTTGVPAIASVPLFAKNATHGADWAIVAEPLSAFSESIRRVRLGIETLGLNERFCVFVTSSLPNEGKTTIALALARSIAATGKKTLIIDADLRRPSVHRYVKRDVEYGLIHYLADSAGTDATKLLTVKETATGLSMVLGADHPAVATDALLMSEKFQRLVAYARENFEAVIIDTSPVGLVVDPQIVARYADGGIFVVRYGSTTQKLVRASLSALQSGANRPISAVLNMDDRRNGSYGKDYDYYYRGPDPSAG